MDILKKVNPNRSVTFSNDLLDLKQQRDTVADLTVPQIKMIYYLVSQIEPCDTEFELVRVALNDFCDNFGISYRGGKNRKLLEEHVLKLMKAVIEFKEAGRSRYFHWVEYSDINFREGYIEFRISKDLKKFYLGLNSAFTSFKLGYASDFTSKNTFALYEVLKRWQTFHGGDFFYDAELAKSYLAPQYEQTRDFIRRVLNPAIEEINEKSDINVCVDFIRQKNGKGRKIKTLCFHIRAKTEEKIDEIKETWNTETDVFAEEKETLKKLRKTMDEQYYFEGFEIGESEENI